MQSKCSRCSKTLNAHAMHDAIAASPYNDTPKCSYCGAEINEAKIKIVLGSKIQKTKQDDKLRGTTLKVYG